MAIYNLQEFCEVSGIKINQIAIYAKRGKIVRSGERGQFIDTDIRENMDFIVNRKAKSQIKQHQEKLELKEVQEIEKAERIELKSKPKAKPLPIKKPAPDPEAMLMVGVKRKLEESKLQKNLMENERARLDIQYKLGKALPTDLVKIVVTQLGQSFCTTYRTGTEQLFEGLARKYAMSSQDIAEFKANLVVVINDCHARAIKTAKGSVKKIIEEQSIESNFTPDED